MGARTGRRGDRRAGRRSTTTTETRVAAILLTRILRATRRTPAQIRWAPLSAPSPEVVTEDIAMAEAALSGVIADTESLEEQPISLSNPDLTHPSIFMMPMAALLDPTYPTFHVSLRLILLPRHTTLEKPMPMLKDMALLIESSHGPLNVLLRRLSWSRGLSSPTGVWSLVCRSIGSQNLDSLTRDTSMK